MLCAVFLVISTVSWSFVHFSGIAFYIFRRYNNKCKEEVTNGGGVKSTRAGQRSGDAARHLDKGISRCGGCKGLDRKTGSASRYERAKGRGSSGDHVPGEETDAGKTANGENRFFR